MADGHQYNASKHIYMESLQKAIADAQGDGAEDWDIVRKLWLLKLMLDLDAVLEERRYNPEGVIRSVEKEVK